MKKFIPILLEFTKYALIVGAMFSFIVWLAFCTDISLMF